MPAVDCFGWLIKVHLHPAGTLQNVRSTVVGSEALDKAEGKLVMLVMLVVRLVSISVVVRLVSMLPYRDTARNSKVVRFDNVTRWDLHHRKDRCGGRCGGGLKVGEDA